MSCCLPTHYSEQVQSPARSLTRELLPFIQGRSLLPLHKGIGNFLFNFDAYRERTQQVRDAGPWSMKNRDQSNL